MKFEYGAMSLIFSLEADNKLTAYSAMVLQFKNNPNMINLYEPEDVVKFDSWFDPTSKNMERFFNLFGGKDRFVEYTKLNKSDIIAAYKTITRIF